MPSPFFTNDPLPSAALRPGEVRVLQQPLDSGALPAARKDAGEEGSEVAPGGRLAAAKASLDALLSIANGAAAAPRRLSQELGRDTAEVRARRASKDPPPCRYSSP